MKLKKVVIFAAAVFLLLIAGCVGVVIYGLNVDPIFSLNNTPNQLIAITELERKLSVEFPSKSIDVQIANGRIINTNLFNTEYLNIPNESVRQKKAKEIAVFITNNYPSINTIDTITITFTKRLFTGPYGMALEQNMSYVFYVNDLK